MCQSHISELHQYIALFGLGSAGGASQCAEQDESCCSEMQLHVAEICGNRYFSSLLCRYVDSASLFISFT